MYLKLHQEHQEHNYGPYDKGSLFPAGNPATAATTSLYDEFYAGNAPQGADDGNYDYSRGKYSAMTHTCTQQQWNGNQLVDDAGFVTSGNLRTLIVKMQGFSSSGDAGKLTGPDGQSQDTEDFLASLTLSSNWSFTCASGGSVTYASGATMLYRVVTQKYGAGIVDRTDTCDSNGDIYLEIDLSCPACIECDSVDGYIGSYGDWNTAHVITATYRVYESLEFEDEMGEVSFDLQGVTVSVTERKLRAQWSPELAQDVSAFHNIDAEAELTALLSEEIAAEVDREILRDLRKGAAWDLRWDYNGWKRFSAGQAPYTQKDWNQTLITAINQISAQIHKSTLRGGANWIVCSSEVSAIFDDLEYFHVSNASADQDQYNMGIEKVGTLSGRFTVYRDPYFPANQVLIGHKGTSLLDTGYVYAPYVPLQLTPTMYNPFNFTPIKGIMTRYAKKMVNNRFYGRITVDGVRTFDVRELKRY